MLIANSIPILFWLIVMSIQAKNTDLSKEQIQGLQQKYEQVKNVQSRSTQKKEAASKAAQNAYVAALLTNDLIAQGKIKGKILNTKKMNTIKQKADNANSLLQMSKEKDANLIKKYLIKLSKNKTLDAVDIANVEKMMKRNKLLKTSQDVGMQLLIMAATLAISPGNVASNGVSGLDDAVANTMKKKLSDEARKKALQLNAQTKTNVYALPKDFEKFTDLFKVPGRSYALIKDPALFDKLVEPILTQSAGISDDVLGAAAKTLDDAYANMMHAAVNKVDDVNPNVLQQASAGSESMAIASRPPISTKSVAKGIEDVHPVEPAPLSVPSSAALAVPLSTGGASFAEQVKQLPLTMKSYFDDVAKKYANALTFDENVAETMTQWVKDCGETNIKQLSQKFNVADIRKADTWTGKLLATYQQLEDQAIMLEVSAVAHMEAALRAMGVTTQAPLIAKTIVTTPKNIALSRTASAGVKQAAKAVTHAKEEEDDQVFRRVLNQEREAASTSKEISSH